MYRAIILGIVLISASTQANEWCPNPATIAPCSCNNNGIYCSTNTTDLAPIFARLSKELDGQNKTMKDFTMQFADVEEFGQDVFQDIEFETILLKANFKLKRIHPDAFKHMSTEMVTINSNIELGADPSDAEDLFLALNKMKKLRSLDLTSNGFTKIPDNAFSIENDHLQSLIVSGPGINEIGTFPFANLRVVTFLAVHNTRIKNFPAGSLSLRNLNKVDFRLVDVPFINGNSFEENFLSINITHPVHLSILYTKARSQITYLDEKIMKSFLELNNDNVVDVYGLDCSDCRNEWIKKYNLEFKKGVMTSWKSCQDYQDPQFLHCHQ